MVKWYYTSKHPLAKVLNNNPELTEKQRKKLGDRFVELISQDQLFSYFDEEEEWDEMLERQLQYNADEMLGKESTFTGGVMYFPVQKRYTLTQNYNDTCVSTPLSGSLSIGDDIGISFDDEFTFDVTEEVLRDIWNYHGVEEDPDK